MNLIGLEPDTNTEYLAKPLIEDTVFTVDQNHVRIISRASATIFVDVRRHIKLSKTALLTLYTDVIRLARERNVRIGYSNHFKRNINLLWAVYERDCVAADELFEGMIEQAKVVEKRGLHSGTRDDAELDKLQKLCWEYEKNYWRSSPIFIMQRYRSELERYQRDLISPGSGTYKIHL